MYFGNLALNEKVKKSGDLIHDTAVSSFQEEEERIIFEEASIDTKSRDTILHDYPSNKDSIIIGNVDQVYDDDDDKKNDNDNPSLKSINLSMSCQWALIITPIIIIAIIIGCVINLFKAIKNTDLITRFEGRTKPNPFYRNYSCSEFSCEFWCVVFCYTCVKDSKIKKYQRNNVKLDRTKVDENDPSFGGQKVYPENPVLEFQHMMQLHRKPITGNYTTRHIKNHDFILKQGHQNLPFHTDLSNEDPDKLWKISYYDQQNHVWEINRKTAEYRQEFCEIQKSKKYSAKEKIDKLLSRLKGEGVELLITDWDNTAVDGKYNGIEDDDDELYFTARNKLSEHWKYLMHAALSKGMKTSIASFAMEPLSPEQDKVYGEAMITKILDTYNKHLRPVYYPHLGPFRYRFSSWGGLKESLKAEPIQYHFLKSFRNRHVSMYHESHKNEHIEAIMKEHLGRSDNFHGKVAFIDDDLKNIIAANAMGCYCIWVTNRSGAFQIELVDIFPPNSIGKPQETRSLNINYSHQPQLGNHKRQDAISL